MRAAPRNKAIQLHIDRITARRPRGGGGPGQWAARMRQSFAASFANAEALRRKIGQSVAAAGRASVAYK